MALHKCLMVQGFALPTCEKHFHDHDETWLILKGRGTGYWIDTTGKREAFLLEAGDVWMIPAGYEHGSDGFPETGRNSEDFAISVFNGTQAPGCHQPGHYYVEKEGYLPSLRLEKTPTTRYSQPLNLPATMRSYIFPAQGQAAIQDEPTPTCRPGTVLCRTLYTGLTNGTERNVMMGGNYSSPWPSRLGYQNVGRVLAVGMGVRGIEVGDMIFSGDCCQHVQYFAAPAEPQNLWVKLPDAVNPLHAALFGMASVAMHDVRRALVKLGEKVLVVGAGPIGQFTAQAARLSGAIVTICDLNQHRLDIAHSLGAQQTITLTTEAASWQAVREAGPFDVVIEDSGAAVLDYIFGVGWSQGVLKVGSRVVLIAGRVRVDYAFNAAQGYELSVIHAGHFNRDDLQQTCRFTAEGRLEIGRMIQDVVKAEAGMSIYERLRDQPASLFGAVFDWT